MEEKKSDDHSVDSSSSHDENDGDGFMSSK